MAIMSHRERVVRALNHQESDRVPLDLGATRSTSIVVQAYERLNRHLGSREEPSIFSKCLNIAHPNQAMLQRFDIDTRSVGQGLPDNWQDIVYPDGSYQDEWGVVRSRPAGCLYYDLTKSPFAGEASVADLGRHSWPDPHDPGRCRGLKEEARRLHQETDYAIALNMPGGVVTQAQFMRGFEDWFADLIADPTFYHALLDRITDLWIEMAKDELDAAGDSVDFCFFGDDVAFQDGPMMSMEGMDTKTLKREFGKDICFWGGIDTQRVLLFGSPADVAAEATRRIEDLGPGGGYVLCAVHNIQADVSPENICAMYDAARQHGQR